MSDHREQRNKQVIRDLLAAADAHDYETLRSFYADDYVDHAPSEARSKATGVDALMEVFEAVGAAFPDTRHTIHDLVAEGDRVALHVSAAGTHSGGLWGIAATGARIEQTALVLYRVVDGRIAERWCPHQPGVVEQLERLAAKPE